MTREQPTEEELEAAEALILLSKTQAPIHPLPALLLSPNLYEDRCCLIGCYVSVQRPLFYCSKCHKNLAEKMAAQGLPIECLGGFNSRVERDRSCGCLLINKVNQIQTGVPQLELPHFFLTKPSELEFVKKDLATSSSSEWIFFHSSPLPYQKQGSKWISEEYTREIQIGSCYIGTRNLKLIEESSSWSLFLFQYAGESLYCLSYVSTGIPEAKMNKVLLLNQKELESEHPDSEKKKDTRNKKKNTVVAERGNTSYVNLGDDEVTHVSVKSDKIPAATLDDEGGEPIKKKIKLKREAGKWMITPDEETVSIADTLLLLQNENPSGTSATMNPPASLNENTLVVETEDQTLMGIRDPNT